MADVLSQSQIDALLHSMQNADVEESKVTQPQPTKDVYKRQADIDHSDRCKTAQKEENVGRTGTSCGRDGSNAGSV